MRARLPYLVLPVLFTAFGCADESGTLDSPDAGALDASADAATSPDATGADTATEDLGVDGAVQDAQPDVPPVAAPVGRCDYTNPFSGDPECKDYVGSGWDEDSASAHCAGDTGGAGMTFTAGEACALTDVLGECVVGDLPVDGFRVVLGGADPGSCAVASNACTTFLGGAFSPSSICEDTGPVVPPIPAGVFEPPTLECVPALDGEPEGATGGEVCTWSMISACTEPGRKFVDYASCDTVRAQRPYYGFDYGIVDDPEDPRLDDAEWLAESDWVREQVEACACVCCHSTEAAPRGPSGWYIEHGPLWVDTLPDSGIAMMAGLADSAALGAYPAEQNNGFDRAVTGMPTTDIDRMRTFFVEEWLRRGLNDDDLAEVEPFGGPLVSQREYEPVACAGDIGIDGEGAVQWGGGLARYVWVLQPDSANPGVPPNLDLPEGTIWHLAVAPTAEPLASGIAYGEVPSGSTQRVPETGEPEALVPGQTYYLYVLLDVAVPLQRCLFVAP